MTNGYRWPALGRAGAFESRLRYGSLAERLVAGWGPRRGYSMLPLGQFPPSATGGGPMIETPAGPRIVADAGFILPDGRFGFFEAKRRRAPTLHRRTGNLVTGIEAQDIRRYLDLADATAVRVVPAIVHDREVPELLGGDVAALTQRLHHEAANMAFWRLDDLDVLASAAEMAELRTECAAEDAAGRGGP